MKIFIQLNKNKIDKFKYQFIEKDIFSLKFITRRRFDSSLVIIKKNCANLLKISVKTTKYTKN